MTYNVLTEPWIPVRRKDGTVTELGILEVLRQAPDLLEITDALPNYEYGMYRLLFVFLMDAYHPKNVSAIRRLLEECSFDEQVISDYVSLFSRDEERFDLFDAKHPFLQCKPDEWENDKNLKSVALLNPIFPCGNNHVHFDHRTEEEQSFSWKEAAKALCALQLFCTAGVQGYPSTPSGAPPVYSIIKGDNLFETLVYGMTPAILYERYDSPPAFWRWDGVVTSKKEVAVTSLLFGLMFPCRRVTLVPSPDQTVKHIYFEQGMNYCNYEAWTDPFVTYSQLKNGRTNLKPNLNKENWRNLSTILNQVSDGPLIVRQYLQHFDKDNIRICTYSVVTKNAAYFDMQYGDYCVSCTILNDNDKFQAFVNALQAVETTGTFLDKTLLYRLQKEMRLEPSSGSLAAEHARTVNRFYFRCRQRFFDNFCVELNKADGTKLLELQNDWEKELLNICWSEYDSFVSRLGDNSRLLITAQQVKATLYRKEKKNGKSK